jgi:putative tryptophan/tyrosine transport system substrate-binding protein
MKIRFELLVLLVAASAGLGLSPQAGKSARIIVAIEGRSSRIQPQVAGLRDGLEELMYLNGRNLSFNIVQESTRELLRERLATELKRERTDVIVSVGTQETIAAREAAPNLPIVFLPAADPLRSGFVKSLGNPGGRITGLTYFTDDGNIGKQFEVFKQFVPPLRRILLLTDARQHAPVPNPKQQKYSEVAAKLGMELKNQPVLSVSDAARSLAALPKDPLKLGIYVACSGLFRDIEILAITARAQRVPLFGCNAVQVAEQQVLMSYGPDLYALGYRGAWFVDRILRGARPEQMPVETPRKFDLTVNRKTAMDIGLAIAPGLLMLADRVFE